MSICLMSRSPTDGHQVGTEQMLFLIAANEYVCDRFSWNHSLYVSALKEANFAANERYANFR